MRVVFDDLGKITVDYTPCIVYFTDGETVIDSVEFDSIELGAEWLCKCGYVKNSKVPGVWTRKGEKALLEVPNAPVLTVYVETGE